MKKLVLATVFALAASSAMAGSIAGPVIEQDVVIQQAASSSVNQNIIPPALFVVFTGLSMLLL